MKVVSICTADDYIVAGSLSGTILLWTKQSSTNLKKPGYLKILPKYHQLKSSNFSKVSTTLKPWATQCMLPTKMALTT